MKRKVSFIAVIFAAVFVFGTSMMAQVDTVSDRKIVNPKDIRVSTAKVPTLGCCKCLDGANSLDLSTVSGNDWTVNGNPVAYPTSIHSAWNLNTGTAKWVSTILSGSTGNIAEGDYEYRLKFVIPNCTINQEVMLSGNLGGDDDVKIFLDNNQLSQCSGGWCFNTNNPPPAFSTAVTPGTHYLIVKVHNSSGPSGMFVNAKLTGKCSGKLTKDNKDLN